MRIEGTVGRWELSEGRDPYVELIRKIGWVG